MCWTLHITFLFSECIQALPTALHRVSTRFSLCSVPRWVLPDHISPFPKVIWVFIRFVYLPKGTGLELVLASPMHAKHTLLALIWSGFYSSGLSTPTCVHHNLHRSVFHHGDRCAQSMQSSKIALLFLTKGDIALEPLWRRWFEDIEGLVYRGCKQAAAEASEDCRAHLHHRTAGTRDGPIASQHLFNVYVALLSICMLMSIA